MDDWRDDAALPARVREVLGELVDRLQAAAGERLRAVVLYGPLARGDVFHPPATPVDLLVALSEVEVALLDALAAPVQRAQRALRVAPLIATTDDLASSCDVFPVKFMDMRDHYRLLYGEDVLAALEVQPEHLRLRCEQEVKNLLLRLRARYVRVRRGDAAALQGLLGEAGATFVDQLRCLLRVREGSAPTTRAAVVERADALDGIDPRLLEELLAIGRGGFRPSEAEGRLLLGRLLVSLRAAAALADAPADPSRPPDRTPGRTPGRTPTGAS